MLCDAQTFTHFLQHPHTCSSFQFYFSLVTFGPPNVTRTSLSTICMLASQLMLPQHQICLPPMRGRICFVLLLTWAFYNPLFPGRCCVSSVLQASWSKTMFRLSQNCCRKPLVKRTASSRVALVPSQCQSEWGGVWFCVNRRMHEHRAPPCCILTFHIKKIVWRRLQSTHFVSIWNCN